MLTSSLHAVQVRQADVYSHSADGREWTLVNNDDKLYMKPGDHFQLRFTANLLDQGGAPQAIATIINMGVERNWTVDPLPNSQRLPCLSVRLSV